MPATIHDARNADSNELVIPGTRRIAAKTPNAWPNSPRRGSRTIPAVRPHREPPETQRWIGTTPHLRLLNTLPSRRIRSLITVLPQVAQASAIPRTRTTPV